MKKWGLALGGGGILGFCHLGVLDVLQESNLIPDFIAGTSAGALAAALFASGLNEEKRRFQFVQRYFQDISAATVSGILPEAVPSALLRKIFGKMSLHDLLMPFAAVSVDLLSGKTVVFTNVAPDGKDSGAKEYCTDADLVTAIRSSISLPGILSPKKYGKWLLVDGGVKENIPLFEVMRMGAQEKVAVDLGANGFFQADNLFQVLSRSFSLCAREKTLVDIDRYASLVIAPKTFEVGLPTTWKIQKLMDVGRQAMEDNVLNLRGLLYNRL